MTTAFVLPGGGSLGAVQVGMLVALAEREMSPDLLVGTSVGAINAAWVAGKARPRRCEAARRCVEGGPQGRHIPDPAARGPARRVDVLDLPVHERRVGTMAVTAIAAWLGAWVFRAHQVRETREVLDMVASIRGDRPPARPLRGLGLDHCHWMEATGRAAT